MYLHHLITSTNRKLSLMHAFKYRSSLSPSDVTKVPFGPTTEIISLRSFSCLSGFLAKKYSKKLVVCEVYTQNNKINNLININQRNSASNK